MAETAEQTMVLLRWQQGEATGTLNLPASTKVLDLKLRLNASDCDAVMFDAVIIEVRKAGSVLKRKLDTQKQDAVVDPSWTSSPSLSRRCASTPSCGAFLAAKEQSTRPWLAVVWPGSRAKVACPH